MQIRSMNESQRLHAALLTWGTGQNRSICGSPPNRKLKSQIAQLKGRSAQRKRDSAQPQEMRAPSSANQRDKGGPSPPLQPFVARMDFSAASYQEGTYLMRESFFSGSIRTNKSRLEE